MLRHTLDDHILERYGEEVANQVKVVMELPRQPEHGDVATPVSFSLAKVLKRSPREIATELAAEVELDPSLGIDSLEAAGAGYINARFNRAAYALEAIYGLEGELYFKSLRAAMETPEAWPPEAKFDPSKPIKLVFEHTNINPNKAAHIGHLRNAVLGDTLARLSRWLGYPVEVQNYIDNTGVQVADVVAGFRYLRNQGPDAVRELVADPDVRFDHLCWDLYAEISQLFAAGDEQAAAWRAETLQALESGQGELAELGEVVADAIVVCHLATMRRIGVSYDLLPRESEILKLKFWSAAFELLKQRGAIRLEESGKNAGCWIMPAESFSSSSDSDEDAPDADKVIVRSDGTVTYVGKDIAYQLWKFGLLEGKDFGYRRMGIPEAPDTWVSVADGGEDDAPAFGRARQVYNVIDVRQSYLQDVVRAALKALGFEEEAENSVHFSYEMVALSPRCCAELGIELTEEERAKPYVEVSGRKGQGVKADDLLDLLVDTALEEVRSRHSELNEEQCREIAEQIAVGALRYFMLRVTRNTVIAFDFQEALAFEGETGPYVQYAAVRAGNILRKHAESTTEPGVVPLREELQRQMADDSLWQLLLAVTKGIWTAHHCGETEEPSELARTAFQAAQAFNAFYHQTHILNEEDPERKIVLLALVLLAQRELSDLLQVMGMPVPEKM